MVEIHLYGKLRHYSRDFAPASDVILRMNYDGETIESLMVSLGIPCDEIYHVFYNSKLLATRTKMGGLYGLPQVGPEVLTWNLKVPLNDGDRIGLFGKDMSILSM